MLEDETNIVEEIVEADEIEKEEMVNATQAMARLAEEFKTASLSAETANLDNLNVTTTATLSPENVLFLDLPFYENGRERNYLPTEDDREKLSSTILEFKPHQLFITGKDLEPSTVQSICYQMTTDLMKDYSTEEWSGNCWVWLYESEKQIFNIGEIDMAVPMSPLEYANKSKAVFQHHSQQDQTPPISSEERLTWPLKSRSDTLHASRYDSLGLAEYEAIETFMRIRF